ncbi:MAG: hypothetical protein RMJ55_20525 [Roseiflexaceae bacterium]|nr:hypothetical protein [Roseiflexaceae bacterium]
MSPLSVLFCEPKIPKFGSSMRFGVDNVRFQCSSASRKFRNADLRLYEVRRRRLSVLFCEPKIPKCVMKSLSAANITTNRTLLRAER